MARGGKRSGKGVFSQAGLPVARRYPRPPSRGRLLLAGAAVCAVVLALVGLDLFLGDARLISNGPLSSNHANLEGDCAACHGGFEAVTDEACSVCHEKHGDRLGVYTFASHYLYRTTDFRRLEPSADEQPCIACHTEHLGREAEITRVPDSRCSVCHEQASFARHPEFDFAADGALDDAGLTFPHVHHVKELMKRRGLVDLEKACLACHNPEPDGRGFRAIDFDRHCDACHLTATDRTPALPIEPDDGSAPGVETLETIRRRGGPGSRWADYLNPAELRSAGDRVVKSPLYHRDPWVLYNLRRLRHRLYGDGGLADLLTATAEVPPSGLETLYREAIATLDGQAEELRSNPERELQQELEAIEAVLAQLRRRLEDPYAPLDETKFLLALGPPADLDPAEAERIDAVVDALTEPCRRCHAVRDATIVRVETDQSTLVRAEFNHRAHILQRRCIDCHVEIPVAEYLGTDEPVDPARDRAEIHYLPHIAQCRECHRAGLVSTSCTTCHLFHPDTGRRSELLLYVDQGEPAAAAGGPAAAAGGR